MSLASKLYNIGKTITEKETIKSLIVREPDSSIDYDKGLEFLELVK